MLLLAVFLALLPVQADTVRTGAQRLADAEFAALDGMRIGLVTNQTATVDTDDGGPPHLIDRLADAPNVELAALFGPEHGLRGEAEAGAAVAGGVDAHTGVPVYSLYGSGKKPPPNALAGLDALVFDVQDVGARFYTYISTMGYAMQAAAEAGFPFVLLDRPNPLGGDVVDGFVREDSLTSFVGLHPIPVQHGLTVGELARMIQGERWLPGLDSLDLRVIPMTGWRRAMRWPATGLPFVPTSPNIPDFVTALVYPGMALLEGTTASEGRGTDAPFLTVGAAWADAEALADTLNARGLPGVRFEPARFVPRSIPGRAASPKGEGVEQRGVRLVVTDAQAVRPVEVGVQLLHALYRQQRAQAYFGPGPFEQDTTVFLPGWLAKLAGTPRLQRMLEAGARPAQIIAAWTDEVAAFEAARRPYLLYD